MYPSLENLTGFQRYQQFGAVNGRVIVPLETPQTDSALQFYAGVVLPKQLYTLPQDWEVAPRLQPLASAWFERKVDWHYLVPADKSACNGQHELERRVVNEKRVISALYSSLSNQWLLPSTDSFYNPDAADYCLTFADKCVVARTKTECLRDSGFCQWCDSIQLCTQRTAVSAAAIDHTVSLCPSTAPNEIVPDRADSYYTISNNGQVGRVNAAQCTSLVKGATILYQLRDGSGMFWHLIAEVCLLVYKR